MVVGGQPRFVCWQHQILSMQADNSTTSKSQLSICSSGSPLSHHLGGQASFCPQTNHVPSSCSPIRSRTFAKKAAWCCCVWQEIRYADSQVARCPDSPGRTLHSSGPASSNADMTCNSCSFSACSDCLPRLRWQHGCKMLRGPETLLPGE